MNGSKLEQVEQSTNVGQLITSDGKSEEDVKRIMYIYKTTFTIILKIRLTTETKNKEATGWMLAFVKSEHASETGCQRRPVVELM